MDHKHNDNALIAALLKGATDVTKLNTGIENSIAPVAIYPTKEHHSLILNGAKTSNTPLNLTLAAREIYAYRKIQGIRNIRKDTK
jgi:hypothetical protein